LPCLPAVITATLQGHCEGKTWPGHGRHGTPPGQCDIRPVDSI